MKHYIFLTAIFSSLIFSTPGIAETDSASGEVIKKCGGFPEKPTIPSGRQSTEEEMLSAQKEMKAYIAEGNSYIECVDNMETYWGEDATDEQKAVIVIFHNKIVDEQQAVADLFNAAVRAFKGRK